MKRSYFYSNAAIALLAGMLAVNGCTSPTVGYQVQQFASLRVMNFAPNCTPPVDVYWDTQPVKPIGNNARLYNLPFGSASVYTNSIAVSSVAVSPGGTTYHIVVTPTRIPNETDLSVDVNLMPGGAYTLLIALDPNNPALFKDTLIADETVPQTNPFSTNATFVRFMNLRSGVGPVTVHVNDPVTGDLITPAGGEGFFQVSPYVPLNTALDTSLAFIATNANNQVLARLSFQTFSSGGYFTLVYGGDPCNTVAANPADTTISALDTFRLHAFDDNAAGNDVTNPITYSYRYNIVNDIYPWVPFDPNNLQNNVLGFLLNGEGFPEHSGYSINPIPALKPGGAGTEPLNSDSSVYNVNYQSAVLANPLDIKGFVTNPAGSIQKQVFDFSITNPATQIPQDKPVTLLFGGADTIPNGSATGYWNAGSGTSNTKIIPMPDVNYGDSVTLVVIGGINQTRAATSSKSYTSFWFQDADGKIYQPLTNSQGFALGRFVTLRIPIQPGSSMSLLATDSIGVGTSRVPGSSLSFTAEAGGIYEVVSIGTKDAPRLLILHVNAKNP